MELGQEAASAELRRIRHRSVCARMQRTAIRSTEKVIASLRKRMDRANTPEKRDRLDRQIERRLHRLEELRQENWAKFAGD